MLGQEKKAGWQLLVHGFLNNTERLKFGIMSKRLKKLVWFHLDKLECTLNLALRKTDPQLYGPARNPWNWHTLQEDQVAELRRQLRQDRSMAGASDGGGSIRIPAHFLAWIGLKPSRGTMPVGPNAWRGWQGAAIDFGLTVSMRDTRKRCSKHYKESIVGHLIK